MHTLKDLLPIRCAIDIVQTTYLICMLRIVKFSSLISMDSITCIVSDVDECAEGTHNCSSELKRECQNTNGSFDCVCDSGYSENGIGLCDGELVH